LIKQVCLGHSLLCHLPRSWPSRYQLQGSRNLLLLSSYCFTTITNKLPRHWPGRYGLRQQVLNGD